MNTSENHKENGSRRPYIRVDGTNRTSGSVLCESPTSTGTVLVPRYVVAESYGGCDRHDFLALRLFHGDRRLEGARDGEL